MDRGSIRRTTSEQTVETGLEGMYGAGLFSLLRPSVPIAEEHLTVRIGIVCEYLHRMTAVSRVLREHFRPEEPVIIPWSSPS